MAFILDNTFSISIIIALIGVAITYFGKTILKSRRELCKDWTSEVLEGIFFILWYFVIPILILTNIIQNIDKIILFSFIFINYLLLGIQFLLFVVVNAELNKKNKIFFYMNILLILLSFSINYYFINHNNLINISVSLLLSFLILTLVSVIYGFNTKKSDYNNLIKSLDYSLIELENGQKIKGKIIKIGDEFIEIKKEGAKDGKTILLNKSKINSIEN